MNEQRSRGSARRRMVVGAAVSMRRRGVDATSFAQVLKDSGAPRGSLYHYFPRGREQMLEEAVLLAREHVTDQLRACFATGVPSDGVRRFADIYLEQLRRTDFADGCPLLVAGLEGERSEGVRSSAGEAFVACERIVTAALVRHGIDETRAAALANLTLAALEGGIALARAERALEPLECTAEQLGLYLDGCVPA